MIDYSGAFGFARIRGSVIPKALLWAVPCSFLVYAYALLIDAIFPGLVASLEEPSNVEIAGVGLFTSILGFLMVFRANLAYGRFWEGVTLVERACAVWLNGVSNLIAFSSADIDQQVEVGSFQYLLCRLVSLLLSTSLRDISCMDIDKFPTLSLDGIDPESLEYLLSAPAQQKVILQWIQRLIIEKERIGVIDISAPILSRVFQEFSVGIVHFIDARKLAYVPFPFLFAHIVFVMLGLFSVVLMPLACALYIQWHKGVTITFLVVFAFMAIHNISVEIEQPFGDDPNDLPLEEINHEFKKSLSNLLESRAQQTPTLVKPTSEIEQQVNTCRRIATERSTASGRLLWSGSFDDKQASSKKKHHLGSVGRRLFRRMSSKSFASSKTPRDEPIPSILRSGDDAASEVVVPDRAHDARPLNGACFPGGEKCKVPLVVTVNPDLSKSDVEHERECDEEDEREEHVHRQYSQRALQQPQMFGQQRREYRGETQDSQQQHGRSQLHAPGRAMAEPSSTTLSHCHHDGRQEFQASVRSRATSPVHHPVTPPLGSAGFASRIGDGDATEGKDCGGLVSSARDHILASAIDVDSISSDTFAV